MAYHFGRSPHGERGLKYAVSVNGGHIGASLPARGAWVEISCRSSWVLLSWVAPRTGSVG